MNIGHCIQNKKTVRALLAAVASNCDMSKQPPHGNGSNTL